MTTTPTRVTTELLSIYRDATNSHLVTTAQSVAEVVYEHPIIFTEERIPDVQSLADTVQIIMESLDTVELSLVVSYGLVHFFTKSADANESSAAIENIVAHALTRLNAL